MVVSNLRNHLCQKLSCTPSLSLFILPYLGLVLEAFSYIFKAFVTPQFYKNWLNAFLPHCVIEQRVVAVAEYMDNLIFQEASLCVHCYSDVTGVHTDAYLGACMLCVGLSRRSNLKQNWKNLEISISASTTTSKVWSTVCERSIVAVLLSDARNYEYR